MRRDRLGQAFLLRCDCTFTLYVTMSLCLWWIISSLAVLFDMSRLMYWAQYNFCNAAASIRWSSIKCGALDGGGTLISLLLTDDSIFLCILGLTCILSSRTRTLNKMTTSHKHKMIRSKASDFLLLVSIFNFTYSLLWIAGALAYSLSSSSSSSFSINHIGFSLKRRYSILPDKIKKRLIIYLPL